MENCLVKTLKGSVVTDNVLPRLGALTMVFDVTGPFNTPNSAGITNKGFVIRTSSDLVVSSETISSLSLNNQTNTAQLPWILPKSAYAGIDFTSVLKDADLTFKADDGMYNKNIQLNISALNNVRFLNPEILKYINMTAFYTYPASLIEPLDLGNINWNAINSFTAQGCHVYGTISDVNDSIGKLNCAVGKDPRGITCDISIFENCVSMTYLGLYGKNVTGDFDSLFDTLVSKGKNSGTIKIRCEGTSCTTTQSSLMFEVTFTSDTTTHPRGWYV